MNKKIIFAGLNFVVFIAVVFSANAATTTPTIRVISPNGGETLETGSDVNIKWDFSSKRRKNARWFKIDLLEAFTDKETPIATHIGKSVRNYAWNIPQNMKDGHYVVRVIACANSMRVTQCVAVDSDKSDAPFSIIK